MSALTTEPNPILIDLPLPIETPRLTLRPVATGDGAAMHACKAETWSQLTRWMPWARGDLPAVTESEVVAREAYAKFIRREDIMMVGIERASGKPVVWTGLHRFCWTTRRFEIGYWVTASVQGQGYATEAANALARYAFGALNARRVEITHSGENHASRRVIEKLGFVREGILRNHHALPDESSIADLHVYGLTSPDALPPLAVRWPQDGPP